MANELIVLAIGGNSLIRDARHKTVPDQWDATRDTCRRIADLIEAGYRVVVTHGNGPQVGFIVRRSELGRGELHDVPLDSCDADTHGAIGYMIQQSLHNELRRRGIARALLRRAEEEARLRAKSYLGLYVSGANPHARSLYEQLGFTSWRVRRSLWASLILRQGTWIYMRKEL